MKDELNALTQDIVDAAVEVHKTIGPGMLESSYDACLAFEVLERGHSVERQIALPLTYKGHVLDCGYRLDMLVDRQVVVEVKAIERLERVHSAQLLSYLRLTDCRVGLIINFNVAWLMDGIKRVVNGFPD